MKAAMTSCVVERMAGGERLILKGGWVFEGEVFRLLRDGQKSAIIDTVTIRKYRHRLGLYCTTDRKRLATSLVRLTAGNI
jgi:hypothetical protein